MPEAAQGFVASAGKSRAMINPDDFVEKRLNKMFRKPPSVRTAGSVLVGLTTLVVVAGGLLIRVLDSKEFHSLGDSFWWSLQTFTTVGYGDIVTKDVIGRIIGAVVMLQGIALITVSTAVITSVFVERARRARLGLDMQMPEEFFAAINSIDERLSKIEARLDER